jgi:aminoglycoside phosphotransferase (APT) family kinase protein
MPAVACDPRRPDEIAAASLAWVRAHVDGGADASWESQLVAADAGLSTFIWFGRLRGASPPPPPPPLLADPVALRVFGTTGDDGVMRQEHAVLKFVTGHGFPAPVPLAAVPVGPENPVGLPWMVLPRVEGEPLLAVIGRAPWAAAARVRELAGLQVRLHSLPAAGAPLPAEGSLVDRWLTQRGPAIEAVASPRARRVLEDLRARAPALRTEEPVVCHGDFHPLNVLSRRDGAGWHHVVIDWTDAAVGDRHFDVARTIALFRVASLVAGSSVERVALRAAGPWLARVYRRAYERAVPLDAVRLAYWSAAHLLQGWWQVVQLHDGAFTASRASTEAIPLSVADQLLTRAERYLEAVPA